MTANRTRRMPPPSLYTRLHRRAAGFVLVATLVAIAIISLGAAYFAAQVDALRDHASHMQRWAEAEREAFSVRETLQFAASLGFRDEGGLTYAGTTLATDGRRYKLSDTLSVSVQDERGLLAINLLEGRTVSRILDGFGIPAERHARLIDTLADYIDPDDLRRLNGAEKAEYAAANKPAPANDFLRTREQLGDILGWDELLDRLAAAGQSSNPGVRSRFIDLFSTAKHFGLNLNSAPPAVLRTVEGLNPARISALVDQRRAAAFTSLGQLGPFSSGPLDSEYLGLVGANEWRVVIHKANLAFLLECQLTITPAEPDRLTRLRECVRRPVTAASSSSSDEFQRALSPPAGSRQSSESMTIRSSNLAPRNDLRDTPTIIDSPAPDWLAEVVSAAGAGRR